MLLQHRKRPIPTPLCIFGCPIPVCIGCIPIPFTPGATFGDHPLPAAVDPELVPELLAILGDHPASVA